MGYPQIINIINNQITIMKTKEEILAKIENLMQEMQQLRNEVAALELVNPVVQDTVENVDKMDELACQYMQEEADSTSVIEDEVEDITLPDPPAEVHIDIPEDNTPDEETIVACQILSKLPDFYNGTCRSIVLQKQWHDNSDKGYTKLHINKYKVVIVAEDIDGNSIGTTTVHWNTLTEWHAFLINRGINKHKETDNPHTNWMPNKVSLCID